MTIAIPSETPASPTDIVGQLSALRRHALVDSSHFSVAAVLELRLANGQYVRVGGVNVEHHRHNRLSLHAEQNAFATAHSLFGSAFSLLAVWVMGAPEGIEAGSQHTLAANHPQPCGHCRQILLSRADEQTRVYSVAVNGTVAPADPLLTLLPKAFSERDLRDDGAPDTPKPRGATDETASLHNACLALTPHLIHTDFQTSDVYACVLRVQDNNGAGYDVSGVLVQDIAFLGTDAVFAAIGQAVSTLGGGNVTIREAHLASSRLDAGQLSGSELETLARFATLDTRVVFHNQAGSSKPYTLEECVTAYATGLSHVTA